MEYGSIFGHGAYLGPDCTADYLHRAALASVDFYKAKGSDQARAAVVSDFKSNRFDQGSDMLTFTAAQANAFRQLQDYYSKLFAEPTTKYGLRPNAITNPSDIQHLTAFFALSACSDMASAAGHFLGGTGFFAAGIFLTPMIAGREPKGQQWLACALLVALAVVVFGSLIGEFIGIHGWLPAQVMVWQPRF
jgi:nitric oxide reductase large subunit